MTKQDVIEAIQREWNAFTSLANSFREEDRVRPGAREPAVVRRSGHTDAVSGFRAVRFDIKSTCTHVALSEEVRRCSRSDRIRTVNLGAGGVFAGRCRRNRKWHSPGN